MPLPLPLPILSALALWFLALNALAFASMAIDKARARNGRRRVPEARLLQLALWGGSLGTLVAQRSLRHKTRKEPFRSRLLFILVLQALAAAALGLWCLLAPGLGMG